MNHEDSLLSLIGQFGVANTLKLLSQITEKQADHRSKKGLAAGSTISVSAGLLDLAERFERERQYENFQMGDFDSIPY